MGRSPRVGYRAGMSLRSSPHFVRFLGRPAVKFLLTRALAPQGPREMAAPARARAQGGADEARAEIEARGAAVAAHAELVLS